MYLVLIRGFNRYHMSKSRGFCRGLQSADRKELIL